MLTYILFAAGFVLLILGGDLLVRGASGIARKLHVSDLVIALTVVAFGTSAPELIVTLFATVQGKTDIAIGNALGSNILNTFVILGLAAVIRPLTVTKGTVWKEIPFSLLAVVLAGVLANDAWVGGAAQPALTRIDGVVLIACLVGFLYYVFTLARKGQESLALIPPAASGPIMACVMVAVGVVCLNVGADWVVDGAIALAKFLGVDESVIALTIVSAGTSLPELATSLVAAARNRTDMAVGNIVGSNIFNVFWILGASSVIRPLPFGPASTIDVAVAAFGCLLLFFWMFVGFKRRCLERYEGAILAGMYPVYLAYLIMYR